MKKIIIVIVLFIASGCKEGFLDSKPSAQLSDANFWASEADAKAGVTAIYDQMQRNYQIYGYLPMTDGMTPNGWIWSNYLTGFQAVSKGNLLPSTAAPFADKWNQLYNGIYKANLALSKIPGVPMDETLKKRLIAEARFMRALFYYNLADFYGGVPLIKQLLTLGDPLPARNTTDEVLKFVAAECDEAAKDLSPIYTGADVGRATLGAALTLKARAYLLNKQFPEAAAAAKQVIDLKRYQLYNDYEKMFTSVAAENNAEVIFDVQYAAPGLGEGGPLDGFIASRSSFARSWNSMFPTQDMVDAYEMKNGKMIGDPASGYDSAQPYVNRDPRLDFTIVRPGASWKGIPYNSLQLEGGTATFLGYLCRKYALLVDGYNWGDSPLNFIVFRYADVLLMYAEAKNEATGPNDQTIYDAINEVRARPGVNMPAITMGKTQGELRDIIRHERRIEFAFEGIYYSDIRRWGIAKDVMNGKVIRKINGDQLDTRNFIDAFYLWPIPQSERDLNPKLEKNPGY